MPVRLHYTWLLAALIGLPLLTIVMLPAALPDTSRLARLALALLILALLFGAVVVHELAHVLVARLLGVRFPVINLYPLGALTRLPDRVGKPAAAFWIALAGPIASVALAWGLGALAATTSVAWFAFTCSIVAQLSLYLGLLNLLPGLPLDGGRMLRAALLWLSSSYETASRIARLAGQLIAYVLVFYGVSRALSTQDWLLGGGLLLAGLAIRDAGGTTRRRGLLARLLHQLTAADVLL
jgi:Zn-dependent protease